MRVVVLHPYKRKPTRLRRLLRIFSGHIVRVQVAGQRLRRYIKQPPEVLYLSGIVLQRFIILQIPDMLARENIGVF